MQRLRVAFDELPLARWGPLFQVLRLEQPDACLEWQPVGFPRAGRSLLDGADVGLFVAPPHEAGVSALTIETSAMVVLMAVGHRLTRHHDLSVAEILDEPFPGGASLHPEWSAFWTLDEHRGGPPKAIAEEVQNAKQGLDVVASGRAIATLPASVADGLPHPGVVAVALRDGPSVETRLVWRSADQNPLIYALVGLAREMTRGLGGNDVSL
jgi:DNA-binding transcriptional LysR family regulator